MQRVQCRVQGLAAAILEEERMMSNPEDVILIATVKYVAHVAAVEGKEQIAPAGVMDCNQFVALDVASRPLLDETMCARAQDDAIGRRPFKNRS